MRAALIHPPENTSSFSFPHRILWIDGLAALVSGLVVFFFRKYLAAFYDVPTSFLEIHSAVSFLYAGYSLSLAARRRRSLRPVQILIAANLGWATICLILCYFAFHHAGWFATLHLVVECLCVGGLGIFEWRYRLRLALSSP